MPPPTLLAQLEEIAVRRVNRPWWEVQSPGRVLDSLCALAFVQNWPRDSKDARVLLAAQRELAHARGSLLHAGVPD